MQIFEDILGKFGSRISINFQPRKNYVNFSALGRFYDKPVDLLIGIKVGEVIKALPFTKKASSFEAIEQDITPNTITFRCRSFKILSEMNVRFIAPFYPKDEKISTAPFFYIDISVNKNIYSHYVQSSDSLVGEILFQLQDEKLNFEDSSIFWNDICQLVKKHYIPYPYERYIKFGYEYNEVGRIKKKIEGYDFSLDSRIKADYLIKCLNKKVKLDKNGFRIPFSVKPKEVFTIRLILAGFINEPVMEVKKEKYKFKYNLYFNSVRDVVKFAEDNKKEIIKKSNSFDSLFEIKELGKTKKDLMSYAIHSYIQNCWWVYKDKKDWFSVWEGNCLMHSTLDVEYNSSFFLLKFWPDLLEKILYEHINYKKKGFMSHDIGAFLQANTPYYHHEMEIEENCNFILLNYALWKFTGRFRHIEKNYNVIKELIDFMIASDTNKNGIPDKGTANTIDDGSAAIQYSKEQIYLAIKTFASYIAVSKFAEELKDRKTEKLCLKYIKLIAKSIDKTWLKDHFPVCIDKSTKGIKNSWTGKPLKGKFIEGWDAYTLYVSNGFLFLLMFEEKIPLDLKKIKIDLLNSLNKSLIEYGCTHSSNDKSNLWISQNIWRDLVAVYLGIDILNMTERYWQFELYENTTGRGGCFIDTYGNNWLSYYPRGVVSIGYLYAINKKNCIKFD